MSSKRAVLWASACHRARCEGGSWERGSVRTLRQPTLLLLILILILILIRFQDETNYPRPSGDASHAIGVGRQDTHPVFETFDDQSHLIEDQIRERLFPHLIPNMFLRIEFRGVSRQTDQPYIFRQDQLFGFVRTGSVQYHDDELLRMRLADLVQERAHVTGVHLRSEAPI